MSSFLTQLAACWARSDSLVCVGLDPEIERFPQQIAAQPSPIFQFNKAIIDATADLVCAYKPQFAHYAAYEAEDQLERTIDYIHRVYPGVPVILDSKRGGHRQHRGALRDRGVRALRRRCRHGEPLPRRRFARAFPAPRRPRRHSALPHLQPGSARSAGSGGRRRRPAALSRGGRSRRNTLEYPRQLSAGRGRHLSAGAGRDPPHRRRHAVTGAGGRRAGRRRRPGGALRTDRRRDGAASSARRAASCMHPPARTFPPRPGRRRSRCGTRSMSTAIGARSRCH